MPPILSQCFNGVLFDRCIREYQSVLHAYIVGWVFTLYQLCIHKVGAFPTILKFIWMHACQDLLVINAKIRYLLVLCAWKNFITGFNWP